MVRSNCVGCGFFAVLVALLYCPEVLAQPRWSCTPRSKNHASCCGKHIKLSQVLGQCDVAKMPKRRSLKKKVAFAMTVSPGPARNGQTVTVTAEFKNLTKRPVDLHFIGHSGPMLILKVSAEDGASVYPPPGPVPKAALLPRPGPPYPVRIRLAAAEVPLHARRGEHEGAVPLVQ